MLAVTSMYQSGSLSVTRWFEMTEKTQKLKPCPFCGGKAKITGYLLYEIKCARCRVTLPQRYESDAIAAWNRRAPQCEKE